MGETVWLVTTFNVFTVKQVTNSKITAQHVIKAISSIVAIIFAILALVDAKIVSTKVAVKVA